MERPRRAAAALLLLVLGACHTSEDLGRLDGPETTAAIAVMATMRGDAADRRVADSLREALEAGRLHRGDDLGEEVMGVTDDEDVVLLHRGLELPGANPEARLLAASIIYHEGVHLGQSHAERLLGRPEEDAYLATHHYQRRLLAAWIDGEPAARRLLAAADLRRVVRAFASVRPRMGREFLADRCPAHRHDDDSFRVAPEATVHERHFANWPVRRATLVLRPDGIGASGTLAFAAAPDAPPVRGLSWRREGAPPRAAVPVLVSALAEGRPGLEARVYWYLVRREDDGTDATDDWNLGAARIALDRSVPGAPRLRVSGALAPGRWDVVYVPALILEVEDAGCLRRG
ncbi:MAG: hypothetical protein R3F20_04560 [Planctomycetota bacterium]